MTIFWLQNLDREWINWKFTYRHLRMDRCNVDDYHFQQMRSLIVVYSLIWYYVLDYIFLTVVVIIMERPIIVWCPVVSVSVGSSTSYSRHSKKFRLIIVGFLDLIAQPQSLKFKVRNDCGTWGSGIYKSWIDQSGGRTYGIMVRSYHRNFL